MGSDQPGWIARGFGQQKDHILIVYPRHSQDASPSRSQDRPQCGSSQFLNCVGFSCLTGARGSVIVPPVIQTSQQSLPLFSSSFARSP